LISQRLLSPAGPRLIITAWLRYTIQCGCGDILLSQRFSNQPGDALVSRYTSHSIDITSLLNAHLKRLALAFAETIIKHPFSWAGQRELARGVAPPCPNLLSLVTRVLVGARYFSVVRAGFGHSRPDVYPTGT